MPEANAALIRDDHLVQQRTRMKMEKLSVSIADAGNSIGLGRSKIYELIKSGELKTIKIGRRTLVTVESIRALVDQKTA